MQTACHDNETSCAEAGLPRSRLPACRSVPNFLVVAFLLVSVLLSSAHAHVDDARSVSADEAFEDGYTFEEDGLGHSKRKPETRPLEEEGRDKPEKDEPKRDVSKKVAPKKNSKKGNTKDQSNEESEGAANDDSKDAGESEDQGDAKQGNKVQDMFSYHKELLPLDTMDWLCFLFSGIGLVIAAGGGIGGGGMLVPLYMIMLQFRPKHCIALSNLTILGGSISNCLFNVHKREPNGRSVIDWDIIVMMEPSTIAGAVMGSFASKYLPDFVLTIALCLVLSGLSYRMMEKGINMFKKESRELENPVAQDSRRKEEAACLVDGQVPQSLETPPLPLSKMFLLIFCFVGCVVFTVLKGNADGSIIGVECGTTVFWILSMATVPWTFAFGVLFRHMLVMEYDRKLQDPKHGIVEGDIKWDRENTIRYPLVCTLAGLFAGLFGVGGGIVKGPLMLEMGVNPHTAAATAAQMILFTTSAACASFEIFGLLEPEYGILCFVMGVGCTAIGQASINHYMKTAKRQSPPVLSIGVVMVLSTVLVGFEAIKKYLENDLSELLKPSSICS